MSAATQSALVPPGAGVPIELGLGRPMIKVGPPLGAQFAILESELPPGGGFRSAHWHEDLDEAFYVLEGELEYLIDGEWRPAPAGTTVFVPAGNVHAFRNVSERPARHLVVGPPGAVELIAELGQHPRERWEEVHERHRSHYAQASPGPVDR
jgi:uncharacterized cupin superfamily protein